ncbi:MAG: coproporphyrinogen III oxidase family protein, partial [Lachnospiraceae bacterium]|nr:coproporphyrinogen III oxidase family protein [Lachnospiraceae bacterium]
MKRMSVYIHIPYCVRKCAYCDFLSFPDASPDSLTQTGKEYKKALLKELELTARKYPDRIVDTVFFGGGTPSHMSAFDIADIMDALRALFPFSDDTEIS